MHNGDLEGLVDAGVAGVTSNPTIVQSAITEGSAYDDQLRELHTDSDDPKEVFLALARDDIRAACDLLVDVFRQGDSSRDGWVSLEVDPRFADDTQATIDDAKRLHEMIDRLNLFVAVRIGNASRISTDVTRMFQVKIGIRNIVIPGARRQQMVVIMLTEDRAETGHGRPHDPQIGADAGACGALDTGV